MKNWSISEGQKIIRWDDKENFHPQKKINYFSILVQKKNQQLCIYLWLSFIIELYKLSLSILGSIFFKIFSLNQLEQFKENNVMY